MGSEIGGAWRWVHDNAAFQEQLDAGKEGGPQLRTAAQGKQPSALICSAPGAVQARLPCRRWRRRSGEWARPCAPLCPSTSPKMAAHREHRSYRGFSSSPSGCEWVGATPALPCLCLCTACFVALSVQLLLRQSSVLLQESLHNSQARLLDGSSLAVGAGSSKGRSLPCSPTLTPPPPARRAARSAAPSPAVALQQRAAPIASSRSSKSVDGQLKVRRCRALGNQRSHSAPAPAERAAGFSHKSQLHPQALEAVLAEEQRRSRQLERELEALRAGMPTGCCGPERSAATAGAARQAARLAYAPAGSAFALRGFRRALERLEEENLKLRAVAASAAQQCGEQQLL